MSLHMAQPDQHTLCGASSHLDMLRRVTRPLWGLGSLTTLLCCSSMFPVGRLDAGVLISPVGLVVCCKAQREVQVVGGTCHHRPAVAAVCNVHHLHISERSHCEGCRPAHNRSPVIYYWNHRIRCTSQRVLYSPAVNILCARHQM